jgi:polyisoprenoid-binding protein YceI
MSFGLNDESRARETGAVSQGTWRVAAEQSRIDLKVRKMGLYFVKGRFKRLSGSVEVGPDGMRTGGTVRIEPRA